MFESNLKPANLGNVFGSQSRIMPAGSQGFRDFCDEPQAIKVPEAPTGAEFDNDLAQHYYLQVNQDKVELGRVLIVNRCIPVFGVSQHRLSIAI